MATYQGDMNLHHIRYYAALMHANEQRLRPSANFISRVQSSVTENMRSILVDWLVDVSVHFEVMSETLHFAVNYIDRALSKISVEKHRLQLVGVACMKIADVFNERSKEYYRQENASEYSYITADEYTPAEVIQMEKQVLNILNFDLYAPTAIAFIKAYNSVLQVTDSKVMLCACYLADLMLLPSSSNKYPPSLIGSSCLFISHVVNGKLQVIN